MTELERLRSALREIKLSAATCDASEIIAIADTAIAAAPAPEPDVQCTTGCISSKDMRLPYVQPTAPEPRPDAGQDALVRDIERALNAWHGPYGYLTLIERARDRIAEQAADNDRWWQMNQDQLKRDLEQSERIAELEAALAAATKDAERWQTVVALEYLEPTAVGWTADQEYHGTLTEVVDRELSALIDAAQQPGEGGKL